MSLYNERTACSNCYRSSVLRLLLSFASAIHSLMFADDVAAAQSWDRRDDGKMTQIER